MRRLIAALVVSATLLSASPVEACWGRHCGGRGCGWGGYGYGGYGYGGYGYGGGGYRGYGYPGWGGYGGYGGYGMSGYPSYNISYPGYYPGTFSSGYAAAPPALGVGYYGVNAPTSYAAPSRLVISLRPTAKTPAAAAQPLKASLSAVTLQKFLGMSQLRPIAPPAPAAMAKTAIPAAPRVANADSRRRAEQLIAEGDQLFQAQNFNSALQRYKAAVSFAPDMAEALWRQGHALVATKNLGLATAAFKRAIALTEDLSRGGFRLDDLYGRAAAAKNGHLEWLAENALAHTGSSDPYFLLGVFLTYDGQAARADKFFQKASDLAGIGGGHIAVFLLPDEGPVRATSVPLSKTTDTRPISTSIATIAAPTEI
jgi:hypothetical protein